MTSKQPNILFLFPDQHRGDWLPYSDDTVKSLGLEKINLKMPNIKKLMESGMTFTNTISPSPLCAPARACLAAGVRYKECGVEDNNVDYPLDKKTFYSVLRESGYNVGGVGKFDLHKKTMYWGLDGWIDDLDTLGFTHAIDNAGKYDAISSGKDEPKDPYMKYLHDINMAECHVEDMKSRGNGTHATNLPDEAYCDNWLTQNGIDMIRSFEKDKPWFLQVNFTGPHNPWDVTHAMKKPWKDVEFPPAVSNTEDGRFVNEIRQNYAAMLENIDRNIGLLIDEVRNRGELENTLIVYSSDHGEMLGDFDFYSKRRPERGSASIPLIISGLDVKKGRVSKELVELQDLANTFLDYAGCYMDEAKESISLKNVLVEKSKKHREYVTSKLNRIKMKSESDSGWQLFMDNHYKYVEWKNGEKELYDLKDDPYEINNIYSSVDKSNVKLFDKIKS
jgi:arylsulfatase A-like enzyme